MSKSDLDNTCTILDTQGQIPSLHDNLEDAAIWRLKPERFSSWTKLIRVQAWVMIIIVVLVRIEDCWIVTIVSGGKQC